jgi:glycosyltransferase involved in cell wall biosynthesis
MDAKDEMIDVIVRTKNSEEFLNECLQSIYNEIPVGRIIIVDAGSTDKTLEIASSFDKVDLYIEPDLNIGQATKLGFSKAKSEWVAVIDSDIILREGWFVDMKSHMDKVEGVEGCRVDHYRFEIRPECKKMNFSILGQALVKREPITNMNLDLPISEDAAIKFNLEKQGMKWKKVDNHMADHYPKIQGTTYMRTGRVYRPCVMHIPKKQQIVEGHIYRQYEMVTKKEVISLLLGPPIRDAVRAFRCRFWFFLAYFKII